MLDTGLNELRLVLSDGWFRGRTGPSRVPDSFGAHTAVVAQLSVETSADTIIIATGSDWEYGTGAITAADLMDGQSVDFTKLLYGDLSGVPPTWIIVGGDDNKCGSGYDAPVGGGAGQKAP